MKSDATTKKIRNSEPMRDFVAVVPVQIRGKIPARLDLQQFLEDLSFTFTPYVDAYHHNPAFLGKERCPHEPISERTAQQMQAWCDLYEQGPTIGDDIDIQDDELLGDDENVTLGHD